MKIGYIRVSTQEQNIVRQEALMESLGVDEVYIDRMSGKNTDRPELKRMLDSEEVGGAPLLGAAKPVIKAHGSSRAKGIKNAIRQAKICVRNDLCGTMQTALNALKDSTGAADAH